MSAVDREDVPNTVRILDVNEATGNTIDLEEPVIIRGAFDRAKTTWEEVWLKGDVSRASEILGNLDLPPGIVQLGPAHGHQFYVGPSWSGTLPHMHSHGIDALARGRKRWAVYLGRDTLEHELLLMRGSADGYGSGSQAAPWFATECPKLRSRGIRLWEFIQESGDVVFIPANYLHAVMNLEPVVGFAAEFRSATMEHQEESWSARFERIVSANWMSSQSMEADARRLLPYINAHGPGHSVLELGPNRHPLMTPDTFDGRIVYLELSDPCIQFLRDTFGDSVAIVKFNLHRAWEAGDNVLKTYLASSLDRDPSTPVSFDSVVLSQVVNYVDFRKLLQACVELLPVGGLLFFNNIMGGGGASLFHARRPKTMEEFLESALEIGFDPIEVVAKPAGPGRVQHLAVLRRRAQSSHHPLQHV